MAEAPAKPAEPVYFRGTEYGITDGARHYANEVFIASPEALAHYERTKGIDPVTGRLLYAPSTEAEYVAQEALRTATEQQDYYAARGGEPTPEVTAGTVEPAPPTPQVSSTIGMTSAPPDSAPLL